MTTAHVEYLGHHWIVLAVPAFLPAIIVVGVVLYVAVRDRRAAPPDDSAEPPETPDETGD